MKKHIIFASICLIAFITGYSINSKAVSETSFRVAVVDVPELISKSSQVTALKNNQQKQLELMKTTMNKAREDIAKETDPAKIEQLEEKYRNEINNQKLALDNEYNDKLKKIDNDIKAIVVNKAKELKYNIVLPKSMVLYGGDDITSDVAKLVK